MYTYYLNRDGSKWVLYDQNHRRTPMEFILITLDGTQKKRRADYFESFGNFAAVHFRIGKVRYSGLFEDFERINGLPVLRNPSPVEKQK